MDISIWVGLNWAPILWFPFSRDKVESNDVLQYTVRTSLNRHPLTVMTVFVNPMQVRFLPRHQLLSSPITMNYMYNHGNHRWGWNFVG